MNTTILRIKNRAKPKLENVTYRQVATYLACKAMPAPLIRACMDFIKEQAWAVGEDTLGPKTKQAILSGTCQVSESSLMRVYQKAPILISEYVLDITSAPDMPSMHELTRTLSGLSREAKHAYLFLTESALRIVYGVLYEPDDVWREVRYYDEDSVTTAG